MKNSKTNNKLLDFGLIYKIMRQSPLKYCSQKTNNVVGTLLVIKGYIFLSNKQKIHKGSTNCIPVIFSHCSCLLLQLKVGFFQKVWCIFQISQNMCRKLTWKWDYHVSFRHIFWEIWKMHHTFWKKATFR